MDAIMFQSGMMTVCGLGYTDGETTRLCTISGNPIDFGKPYFSEVITRENHQTD